MEQVVEHLAAAVMHLTPEQQQALASVDPAVLAATVGDVQGRGSSSNNSVKSPEVVAVLEEAYKSSPYPLRNKETRDRLIAATSLTSGQLQDWFYRRRTKDCLLGTGKPLHADAADALHMVEHIAVASPKQPSSLEEAQQYLGRTVIKYFEPVPALSYPGGNAAGTVTEVQVQALPPGEHPSGSQNSHPLFLFLVKYGDSYEEHVPWDQLANILLPIQTPAQYESVYANNQAGHFGSEQIASTAVPATGAAAGSSGTPVWALGLGDAGSAGGAANRKAPPKRHRPFRYIQLPVGMAHPLFGESTFPVALTARMFIDGKLAQDIAGASLIRCKHPRTQFGWQYQLYGVQDFRRMFQERQLKVSSMSKGEDGHTLDIYFTSGVSEEAAWQASNAPGDTLPLETGQAPKVPSAFVHRSFPNAQFPLAMKMLLEVNGHVQGQAFPCTIVYDAKTNEYFLNTALNAVYNMVDLTVDDWRKVEQQGEDIILMCCRQPPTARVGHQEGLMAGATAAALPGQPTARKRGRPRKNPLPAALPSQTAMPPAAAQPLLPSSLQLGGSVHGGGYSPMPSQLLAGLDPHRPAPDYSALLSAELLASLASAVGAAKPAGDTAVAAAEAAAAALTAMLGATAGASMHSTQATALMDLLGQPNMVAAAGGAGVARPAAAEAAAASTMTAALGLTGPGGLGTLRQDQGEIASLQAEESGSPCHKRQATGVEGSRGVQDTPAPAAACNGLLALVTAGSGTGTHAGSVQGSAGASSQVHDALSAGGPSLSNHAVAVLQGQGVTTGLAPVIALDASGGAGLIGSSSLSAQPAGLHAGPGQHPQHDADSAAAAALTAAVMAAMSGGTAASLSGSAPHLSMPSLPDPASPVASSLTASQPPAAQSGQTGQNGHGAAMTQLSSGCDDLPLQGVMALAPGLFEPSALGPRLAQAVQLVSPVLCQPSNNEEGGQLLHHLNVLVGSLMIEQHSRKDLAWGLMSTATEALKLLMQQGEKALPVSEEQRALVVGLLNEVMAVLMATTSSS